MTEHPKENTVQVQIYNAKSDKHLPNDIIETENNADKKSDEKHISSNTTILRASLMLTNMCLGTSIFTICKMDSKFWISLDISILCNNSYNKLLVFNELFNSKFKSERR